MPNVKIPRPSASMVVASAALVVALGGGAYAQSQLAKNSVGSPQLRNNAVTAQKIGPNAVVSSRIKDGQVRSADIRNGNVQREDLAVGERTIWIAVRGSDGTGVRQSGEVTASTRVSVGRYLLTFNRPVNQCAWVASTSSDNTTGLGYAEAHLAQTGPNQLDITTARPQAGVSALADSDFHLVVACGQTVAAR